MKRALCLFVLAVYSSIGPFPVSEIGAQSRQSAIQEDVESRLMEKARLLYGPNVPKTLIFTNRAHRSEITRRGSGQDSQSDESPFSGSDHEDITKDMSGKGDVGSGVILIEEKGLLYLDLTPCRAKSTIFTFHSPFAKKYLGTLSCNGKRVGRFLIAQR